MQRSILPLPYFLSMFLDITVHSWILSLILGKACAALQNDRQNASLRDVIVQQDLNVAPPYPIMDIGFAHIMNQIGANATRAANETMPGIMQIVPISRYVSPMLRQEPAQCGPNSPCADSSC